MSPVFTWFEPNGLSNMAHLIAEALHCVLTQIWMLHNKINIDQFLGGNRCWKGAGTFWVYWTTMVLVNADTYVCKNSYNIIRHITTKKLTVAIHFINSRSFSFHDTYLRPYNGNLAMIYFISILALCDWNRKNWHLFGFSTERVNMSFATTCNRFCQC